MTILTGATLAQLRAAAGRSVAVLGAGTIGLLTLAVLRAHGAGKVVSTDPSLSKRERAAALGADATIDSDRIPGIDKGTAIREAMNDGTTARRQPSTPATTSATCPPYKSYHLACGCMRLYQQLQSLYVACHSLISPLACSPSCSPAGALTTRWPPGLGRCISFSPRTGSKSRARREMVVRAVIHSAAGNSASREMRRT